MYFYPRPPRGGRRRGCGGLPLLCIFLSTPSARRATTAVNENFDLVIDFYPRPPRGGRPTTREPPRSFAVISIHALREEGDWLSSLSARRWRISIHALREEGDKTKMETIADRINISIHALREEGDAAPHRSYRSSHGFLSTPSARRATQITVPCLVYAIVISIHALREEGDQEER